MSDFLPEKPPYQSKHGSVWPLVVCGVLLGGAGLYHAWQSFAQGMVRDDTKPPSVGAPPADVLAKARQGDAAAQYQMGRYYMHRDDWRNAVIWYERAAAQGNADAQNNAGVAYMEGRGVAADKVKGCAYLKAAHEQLQTAHSADNVRMCEAELKP
ncbi:tetratricopeptide repeat protein [Conchiformibius kuhniae]|uniref:Tetratricopeptide repeat protein n=1 Tax=Conchiformibius kuhniae TaxID=211502 RepID=A0ABD8B8B4_9NEIS|nr:sel1 repeat family protein [Conchiformibius kuhniae]